MLGSAVFMLVCGLIGHRLHKLQDTGITKLPTLRQLMNKVVSDVYLLAGTQEVTRFLAPYTTSENEAWIDMGCETCGAMRMNVTKHELDTEGWTYFDGVSRCPACVDILVLKHIYNGPRYN